MRNTLLATLFIFATFISVSAQAATQPTPTQEPTQAQSAVLEYLQLRQSGNPHRPAMAKIREKFKITDEEFEKAASQVSAQGYSREEDRQPSSRK